MKHILVFGAGKSASVLIEYLLTESVQQDWQVTVVDANLELAKAKTGEHSRGKALSFDIKDSALRQEAIAAADIVISLLPPALHILVAIDCLASHKTLLTASYVDEQVKKLQPELEKNKVLFLYEMGLDPGIDHMSAMKVIDGIRADGGKIISFKSHCGGLVAPESDDNPWHYKISWNPRNVVTAGKAGAVFLENGQQQQLGYKDLFQPGNEVDIPGLGTLSCYPNRDSLSYIPLYGLNEVSTFIRTTLRHPDFIYGWKNIMELGLTDEDAQVDTNGKTLSQFFKEYFNQKGFGNWMQQKISDRFTQTKELLDNLLKLNEAERSAVEQGENIPDSMLMIDPQGGLERVEIEEVKNNAAATIAKKMHEANLTISQLAFLGMDDEETLINLGTCSVADVLQFALEKKLALQTGDKDMIVMLHEIEFEKNGRRWLNKSSLIVKGKDQVHTAMAKTVGMPLGIAAKLILNDQLSLKGLQVPVVPEIYFPVLKELERFGIAFNEEVITLG